MKTWTFKDTPNTPVIANKKIVFNSAWIAYVSHEGGDGSWQFHTADNELSASDASVVSLQNIVDLDETINALADLPAGWHAWRDDKLLPWKRGLME